MNPFAIFKIFSPKGSAQAVTRPGISTLIISAAALSLVAFAAYIQIKPASGLVGAVMPAQAEASGPSPLILTAIDPADRKFFSPDYIMFEKVEVLPAAGKEIIPDQDLGLMEFPRGDQHVSQ